MVKLYNIGVDTAKKSVVPRLLISTPGPGYCHFPMARNKEYFRQITAEHKTTIYKGRRKREGWERLSGRRNEALDMRVYAYAGLCSWLAESNTLEALWAQNQSRTKDGLYTETKPRADEFAPDDHWGGGGSEHWR